MISARLRSLRKERKLTQEQLAKAIGIKRDRYKSYENDIAKPPEEILDKLADFYETTIDYIKGRTDERKQKFEYDLNDTSPDLNKILREDTPHWDGQPLTSEQANAIIAFYETLLAQNITKKDESGD